MEKYLTIIIFSFLLLFGCNEESNVSSPIHEANRSYQLIKLPPRAGLSVETTFSITETIDGEDGGELKIKDNNKIQHCIECGEKIGNNNYLFVCEHCRIQTKF